MELTCPKCQASMRQYERNGVTVDQCQECRGIFLDRGELEHLLDAETAYNAGEKSRGATPPPPAPATPYPTGGHPQGYAHPTRRGGYSPGSPDSPPRYGYAPQGQRRRKSFLSELFD